jgi:hypothetical protein
MVCVIAWPEASESGIASVGAWLCCGGPWFSWGLSCGRVVCSVSVDEGDGSCLWGVVPVGVDSAGEADEKLVSDHPSSSFSSSGGGGGGGLGGGGGGRARVGFLPAGSSSVRVLVGDVGDVGSRWVVCRSGLFVSSSKTCAFSSLKALALVIESLGGRILRGSTIFSDQAIVEASSLSLLLSGVSSSISRFGWLSMCGLLFVGCSRCLSLGGDGGLWCCRSFPSLRSHDLQTPLPSSVSSGLLSVGGGYPDGRSSCSLVCCCSGGGGL